MAPGEQTSRCAPHATRHIGVLTAPAVCVLGVYGRLLPVPLHKGFLMPTTVLEQLLELQRRPHGAEVLIDAGAVILGEGEQWTRVRKLRPKARFQVIVTIEGVGTAQYRVGEIRGMREVRHAAGR